jgi:glutathione S-transferase
MLQQTGRQTVPYLVDTNTNQDLFESNVIIEYPLQTYGPFAGNV